MVSFVTSKNTYKKNKKNPQFPFLMSHKKWAKCFTKGNTAAEHPKLLKLLQFRFVIPAHNGGC